MGIIKRGILGGVANKIGNVVGSSWKGIATLRSLPLSVANPRTVAQRTNRNSFAMFSKLGSDVLATVCQPLWNRDAKQMSGFNAYVMNNKRAYDEDPVAWMANPIMSKGVLSADLLSAGLSANGSSIVCTWSTSLENPQDSDDDRAYVQVIHQDLTDPNKPVYRAKAFSFGALRSSETMMVPKAFDVNIGDRLFVSLSFKSADGREVATSSSRVITIS